MFLYFGQSNSVYYLNKGVLAITQPRQHKEKRTKHYKSLCGEKVGNVLASALLCFDFVENCLDP